ncbi:hypothetical protein TNCV_420721 [Trichonephila clavipes]|nr:hypothetical protein TNCV_420721 [Trichonephila clavipes]
METKRISPPAPNYHANRRALNIDRALLLGSARTRDPPPQAHDGPLCYISRDESRKSFESTTRGLLAVDLVFLYPSSSDEDDTRSGAHSHTKGRTFEPRQI